MAKKPMKKKVTSSLPTGNAAWVEIGDWKIPVEPLKKGEVLVSSDGTVLTKPYSKTRKKK